MRTAGSVFTWTKNTEQLVQILGGVKVCRCVCMFVFVCVFVCCVYVYASLCACVCRCWLCALVGFVPACLCVYVCLCVYMCVFTYCSYPFKNCRHVRSN